MPACTGYQAAAHVLDSTMKLNYLYYFCLEDMCMKTNLNVVLYHYHQHNTYLARGGSTAGMLRTQNIKTTAHRIQSVGAPVSLHQPATAQEKNLRQLSCTDPTDFNHFNRLEVQQLKSIVTECAQFPFWLMEGRVGIIGDVEENISRVYHLSLVIRFKLNKKALHLVINQLCTTRRPSVIAAQQKTSQQASMAEDQSLVLKIYSNTNREACRY